MINSVKSLLFHIFFLLIYRVKRGVKLSSVKYFNQKLLHYSQKFAAKSDYIFFARNILQNGGLQQQLNIAMRKVTGVLNAGSFKSVKSRETVK